jgi:uncharacterized membrane protein YeiH
VRGAVRKDGPYRDYVSAVFIGASAAVGGGVLVDVISGRRVEVIHQGPWNATAALAGGSVYVTAAALGAPTGVTQAAAFVVAVTMRLASLRWGLQTPLPADLGQKLAPRRPGDEDPPRNSGEDKPQ